MTKKKTTKKKPRRQAAAEDPMKDMMSIGKMAMNVSVLGAGMGLMSGALSTVPKGNP